MSFVAMTSSERIEFFKFQLASDGPSPSGLVECLVIGDWLHVHFPRSIKVRKKRSDGTWGNERVYTASTKFFTEADICWLKKGGKPQFNPQGYMMLPTGNRFSRQAKRRAGNQGSFAPV